MGGSTINYYKIIAVEAVPAGFYTLCVYRAEGDDLDLPVFGHFSLNHIQEPEYDILDTKDVEQVKSNEGIFCEIREDHMLALCAHYKISPSEAEGMLIMEGQIDQDDYFPPNAADKSHRLHLGEQIKKLRLSKGLAQDQVAQRIWVHKSTISKIEAGKWNVSIDQLYKIIHAIDNGLEIRIVDRRNR